MFCHLKTSVFRLLGIISLVVFLVGVVAPHSAWAVGKMYWTNPFAHKIQRANLDGTDIEDLVTAGVITPSGIALDLTACRMYWTIRLASESKILRANTDGSDLVELVSAPASFLSIALDIAAGKMYFGPPGVQRANLSGSDVETLVTGVGLPASIALDVAAGKMYWVNTTASKIQRANLDGSNVEDLVTLPSVNTVPGIALAVMEGKMYWTENRGKIRRANFDGSNVEDLVTEGPGSRSIALDEAIGKMYWGTNGGTGIKRANLNGSQIERLVSTSFTGGIALDVSGICDAAVPQPCTPEFDCPVITPPRVINIDARINGDPLDGHTPVTFAFPAGSYQATLVNPNIDPDARFTAWTPSRGSPSWRTDCGIRDPDLNSLNCFSSPRGVCDDSPEAAFACTEPKTTRITVPTEQVLTFFVPDNVVSDNDGGVSLLITEAPDLDEDGFTVAQGDCDDTDSAINPGAAELCNGRDDNCNTTVDEGFPLGDSCSVGQGACQSTGTLICSTDGQDTQCTASPGVPGSEVCNTSDDDCDGAIDEDPNDPLLPLSQSCYSGLPGTEGVGSCQAGVQSCSGGVFGSCVGEVVPAAEVCDGLDNDCDGAVDEGGICDGDGDEIFDTIDGTFTQSGGFVDESGTPSLSFTDQHLGGTTFGSVIDSGGLGIEIKDAPAPTEGILIDAISGSGPATLSVCGGFMLRFSVGSSLVVTCGSVSVRVVTGEAEVVIGDIVIIVPLGAEVTIAETAQGQVEITNISSDMVQIVIEIPGQDPQELQLDPGESTIVNQPPVARCQDVTMSADATCQADASVDAGSFDPDGDPISLEQSPAGPYNLGTTDVTLTVTDDMNTSNSCSATVTVQDTTAPGILSVAADPSELWPPNHKMVPVTVTATALDACDEAPSCTIISVSSNEPEAGLGNGDKAPDWETTGDLTVDLRAERSGTGNGRVYTITVECTDASGNSSAEIVTVTVPHDKGKKK